MWVTWIRVQLADPTSLLHALGLVTLAGEVGKHWVTGVPVDAGTIAAGIACFSVGGVIDHFREYAKGTQRTP